ncbi:MAG: DUF421 domain-containing protein [Bacillota bacterium]|nr:DUF421 domain-containing protein [Bacillota bacterium]
MSTGGGIGGMGGQQDTIPLWLDVIRIIGRTVFLFFLTLLAIRIMGKRSIANLAPFDLVVIIIIGSVAAIPIQEHTRLVHGIVPILMLAGLQWIMAWVSMRWRVVERITQGVSRILVKDGKILHANMRAERVSMADLWIELRVAGVDDISEVKQATLEPDGLVSVIKTEESSPLTPKDTYALTQKRIDTIAAENAQRLRLYLGDVLERRKRTRV